MTDGLQKGGLDGLLSHPLAVPEVELHTTQFEEEEDDELVLDEVDIEGADTASQLSFDVSLASPIVAPRVLAAAAKSPVPMHTSDYTSQLPLPTLSPPISSSPTPSTDTISSQYEEDAKPVPEALVAALANAPTSVNPAISSPPQSPSTPSVFPSHSIEGLRNAGKNSRASEVPSIASNMTSRSFSSTSSYAKKVRPESVLLDQQSLGKLILGLIVVDFNHIVGPTIEMAHPKSITEDEEMCKILPFLALPDGAHLNQEDYSYFHIVPTAEATPSPRPPQTIFGISCNRQIATSTLLSKEADVTRSTVQKAIVVLASKPLFGPIRDKLGVVTRAFFNQRDFRDHSILVDFCDGLEPSLRAQLTESGVYMGTSLRELVHKFRYRTLILLKLLMLQKKMMFFGHPVERLCTYQYSLISLIPGLLLALEDCGSPPLASRMQNLKRATELKSSDRKSLLKFMGLPLEIFGEGAFFQPYLPLQQIDMLQTNSFLCGTTNSIVTHQRDSPLDLLVNIEDNTFDFRDPVVERLVSLTPADRKWMDDIVRDVNEGWNENDPQRPSTMQFKGSDDYLRVKFEDYITSALSCVKYADFLTKSARNDVIISGTSGDPNFSQNFGEPWLAAFRQTPAFAVWDQVTDPVIFDIIEPRHPCDVKPSAVADIGLRLAEGIHELKLEKNLGPTRDAITGAISTGSTSFFKALEGMRSEVSSRLAAPRSASTPTSAPPSPGLESPSLPRPVPERRGSSQSQNSLAPPTSSGLRPLSLGTFGLRSGSGDSIAGPVTPKLAETASAAKATLGSWGAGIGSFWGSRAPKLQRSTNSDPPPTPPAGRSHDVGGPPSRALLLSQSPPSSPTFQIRDLDKEREELEKQRATKRKDSEGDDFQVL